MDRQHSESADPAPEANAVGRTGARQISVQVERNLGSNTDPATWHGFLHRAIDDPKRFLRLCVLLVVTTAALIAVGLLAPEALTLVAQLLTK